MRSYASIEDARHALEPFARLEPKLRTLWELCRHASPPASADPEADSFDADPFEGDSLAAGEPDDGWCAEDYFGEHVKSELLELVGVHRTREPHELATSKAYDTVYDILLNHALVRACACCAPAAHAEPRWAPDSDRPAHW